MNGLVDYRERDSHLFRPDEALLSHREDITNGAILGMTGATVQSTGLTGTWGWLGLSVGSSSLAYVARTGAHWHMVDGGAIYVVPSSGGTLVSYAAGASTTTNVGISKPTLTMTAVADAALEATPPVFADVRSKRFLPKIAVTKWLSDPDRESNPQFSDSLIATDVTAVRKGLTVTFAGGDGAWNADNTPTDVSWRESREITTTTLQVLPYDLENSMTLTTWYVKTSGTVSSVKVECRASESDDWQLFGTSSTASSGVYTVTGSFAIDATGSQSSLGVRVSVSGATAVFVGQKFKGTIYFPLMGRIALDAAQYRVWRDNGTAYELIDAPLPSDGTAAEYFDGAQIGASASASATPTTKTAYTLDTDRVLVWKEGGYPDLGDATNRTIALQFTEDHAPPPQMAVIATALHASAVVGRGGGGSLLGFESANPRRLRWSMAGNINYWPQDYYIDLADAGKAIITNSGYAIIFTPTITYKISGVNDALPDLAQLPIGHHIRYDAGKSAVWTPFGTIYLSREGLAVTDGRDSELFSAGKMSKYYWDALTVNAVAYHRDRYELFCADRTVSVDLREGLKNARFTEDDAVIVTSAFQLKDLYVSTGSAAYVWGSAARGLWQRRTGLLSNGNLLIGQRMRVVSEGSVRIRWVDDVGGMYNGTSNTTGYVKTLGSASSARAESYFRLPTRCRGRYPSLMFDSLDATGALHSVVLEAEVHGVAGGEQRA